MNILLVSDTLHGGGAETFVLRLATKLRQFGHKADILCLNPDVEDKALIAQYPGLVVHRVFLPAVKWIKRFDKVLRKVGVDYSLQNYLTKRVVCKEHLHYDVYHTHLFPVDYLFAQIKEQHPEIVIVSTLHGDYNEFEEFWHADSIHKKLKWPDKIKLLKENINSWVFISKQQHALFRETFSIPKDKLIQIYNGYESDKVKYSVQSRQDNEELTFIMVARGIQQKGWEYLIKAFRKLEGKHKLVLVGKGDFLEGLSKEYGVDKRIQFKGFHPSPILLINESDVFVFPSVYGAESLPTVIIEALYCGLPVISTRIGEVGEMLIGNEEGEMAGMLIEPVNEDEIISALYKAMSLYIDNAFLRRNHSEIAHMAYQKFRMDTCTQSYLELYKKQVAIN